MSLLLPSREVIIPYHGLVLEKSQNLNSAFKINSYRISLDRQIPNLIIICFFFKQQVVQRLISTLFSLL